MELFQTDTIEVRREICWILSNIGHLGNRKTVIEIYLHFDIMRIFVNMLEEDDPFTLDTVLESLYKILIIGMKASEDGTNVLLQHFLQYNGGERLQQLQHHESSKIYNHSVKILTKFFVVENNEEFI